MSSPYQAKLLSPILPVADLARSAAFYHEVLGFSVAMVLPTYAIASRGGASLHLTLAEDAHVLAATRGHLSIYLEVENITALWSTVSLLRGQYRLRDLCNREYGMREFHIEDPDGCLIFVGEEIPAPAAG